MFLGKLCVYEVGVGPYVKSGVRGYGMHMIKKPRNIVGKYSGFHIGPASFKSCGARVCPC